VLSFEEKWPRIAPNAVANAHFLQRVVRYMAGRGIRQILDLGAGKPRTQAGNNVHEILGETTGDGSVVYVGKDPRAHPHARAI
jgi:hypothetical protein